MKSVATPSDIVEHQRQPWAKIDALMGGVKGMRAAGDEFLPREKGEDDEEYQSRLKRTWLFPGFEKTVTDMCDKVFAKPVRLNDDVPEPISALEDNIDLAGRGINNFASDVMTDGLSYGISWLFVDMPTAVAREDGQAATLADEQAQNIRPYICHVKAGDVLGWRTESIQNVPTLTQFRFMERVEEIDPDDEFSSKKIEQVRVLDRDGALVTWRTFRKAKTQNSAEEWVKHDSGTLSIDEIPVVPFYAKRTGLFTARPPLNNLADINIAHWQSSSDQRNILHIARVPFLFGAGFPVDDKGGVTVSVSRATFVTDPAAKLGWVEHTGASIEAGRQDLKDLESQMQVLGLELLMPATGGATATEASIDQAKMNSALAMMADNLKDSLETALGFMSKFLGLGGEGGSVEINKDFGITLRDSADVQALIALYNDGVIGHDVLINEFVRRGILMEGNDYDEDDFDELGLDKPPPLAAE